MVVGVGGLLLLLLVRVRVRGGGLGLDGAEEGLCVWFWGVLVGWMDGWVSVSVFGGGKKDTYISYT